MSITEDERLELRRQLEAAIGEDATATLMRSVPPVEWERLATKDDLDDLRVAIETRLDTELSNLRTELRTEFHVGMSTLATDLRVEMADLRSEMRTEMADLRSEMRSEMNDLRLDFAEFRDDVNRRLTNHVRVLVGAHMATLGTTIGAIVTLA